MQITQGNLVLIGIIPAALNVVEAKMFNGEVLAIRVE
jgi:hypothetical protein